MQCILAKVVPITLAITLANQAFGDCGCFTTRKKRNKWSVEDGESNNTGYISITLAGNGSKKHRTMCGCEKSLGRRVLGKKWEIVDHSDNGEHGQEPDIHPDAGLVVRGGMCRVGAKGGTGVIVRYHG